MSARKPDQDNWLAEAAAAMAEAERLTGLLALSRDRDDLALVALQSEIMGLRREIERLQHQRAGERRQDFDPEWIELSAWSAGP